LKLKGVGEDRHMKMSMFGGQGQREEEEEEEEWVEAEQVQKS